MAIGTGNLPYPMSPVSPFDVITSQAENERIANIESLADGTGIGDNAITTAKVVDNAITADKVDFTTLNFGNYSTSEVDTGFKWIDGKTIFKKNLIVTSGFSDYTTVAHGVASGIQMLIPGISAVAVTRRSGIIQTDTPGRSIQVSGANIGFNIDAGTGASTTRADVIIYYTKV